MDNVALNKPAVQSSVSVWSRSPSTVVDAKGANNGVIDGGMGFHTDVEASPWWQVDLEDVYAIRSVRIYNRRHMAERLRLFSVLVSLDGRNWATAFTKMDATVFGAEDDAPYVVEIPGPCAARFVRLRLNTRDCLHFDELEVYGDPVGPADREAFLGQARRALDARQAAPAGRSGRILDVGGFSVFADTQRYHPHIVTSLEVNAYESRERTFLPSILSPGQRVLEVGTAIGVVTMTAASIVGPENVTTFEANARILSDARENFARNGMSAIRSFNGVMQNLRAFKPNGSLPFGISNEFWASRLGATGEEADIVEVVQVPTFCLERELLARDVQAMICDIEGGEAELLTEADLPGVSLLLMETHYGFAGRPRIDAMVRALVLKGFTMDLALSGQEIVVMRR